MNNESTLKEILGQIVNSKSIKDRYELVHIRKIWAQTLGKTIETYTSDIRFYRGVLTVVISSSPLRQELNFGRDKLLKLLNEALGEDLIKDIKIF